MPAKYTKWTNIWKFLTPLDYTHLKVILRIFGDFFIFWIQIQIFEPNGVFHFDWFDRFPRFRDWFDRFPRFPAQFPPVWLTLLWSSRAWKDNLGVPCSLHVHVVVAKKVKFPTIRGVTVVLCSILKCVHNTYDIVDGSNVLFRFGLGTVWRKCLLCLGLGWRINSWLKTLFRN
jgi:hypothetical protein